MIGPDNHRPARLNRMRTSVAIAATGLLAALGLATPALADQHTVPQADILDVDLTDGSLQDRARDVEPELMGSPEVTFDAPLDRHVVSTDGIEDSVHYELAGQYENMVDSISVECVFRYDGDLAANERSLCANKEAGGFATVFYGDELTFTIHIGGGYQSVAIPAEAGRWYHTLGVWDGGEVHLYVDGELAGSAEADGDFLEPQQQATNMVLGGDSGPQNSTQFPAEVTISTSRIFSEPLTAADAATLYQNSGIPDGQEPVLLGTNPAEGDYLTSATEFDVDFEDDAVLSRDQVYTLDGEPIEIGEVIGHGLQAGEHTIGISIVDVFGRDFTAEIPFTSGNIPVPAGTSTRLGNGSALLTSTAIHPTGGRLDTRFTEGAVSVAEDGFGGTITDVPDALDFDYDDQQDLPGAVRPGDRVLIDSASTRDLPFQRFDVEVPDDGDLDEQQLVWSGTADPAREVRLVAWDVDSQEWDELASGRGVADGQLSLVGDVEENHLSDGTVHAMVLGYDPLADDLDEPVRDAFEDPDDYDFAIAHLTDTQYLMQGAVIKETAQERAVWQSAYNEIAHWIADNHEERKIAYAAHTGDVIESWHHVGSHDTPEGEENARAEFEAASQAQEILEASGIPNGVLPGNHDNLRGSDSGPDSLFNEYFGPERYLAQAEQESWQQAGASYHPWREGDNDNHYDLFTAGGLDFIALHLGYDVIDEEVQWANEVLGQYADRNALIFTHAYNGPSISPDGRDAGFSHDGRTILEGVIENNRNVAMVMSGHEHGVSIVMRRDVSEVGNHVAELLADYQFYVVGSDELGLTEIGDYDGDTPLRFGASFFRLLQFDLDNSEVSVDTYSPLLDNFGATEYDDRERYDGTEDDFRLPIQLETRTTSFATDGLVLLAPTDEVIGEAVARSGRPASVRWTGLAGGQVYGWYATSSDAQAEGEPGFTRQFEVFTARSTGSTAGSDGEAAVGSDAGVASSGTNGSNPAAPERSDDDRPRGLGSTDDPLVGNFSESDDEAAAESPG